MKKILIVLLFLLIEQTIKAQTSEINQLRARIDSSETTIRTLKNQLDTSQYTRIPNKDFDQIIDDKVLSRFVSIVGLLGTILGLAGYAAAKSFIDRTTKGEGQKTKIELEKLLKTYNDEFKSEVRLDYKTEINKFRNEFEEYKLRVSEYDEREKADSIRRERYMLEVRYDRLMELGAELRKDGIIRQDDNLEKDLKELLRDANSNLYHEIARKIIDTLSTYLYNLGRKDNELIQLIDEYEKKNPDLVSGDAYTNSVLVQFNSYFNATLPQNRDKFLESLITLEKKIPDYGHASALRLEVFMLEYKITCGEEKKKIKNQILTILNQVISSYRSRLAYETVDRLKLDLGSAAFAPNVRDLYQLFPEEMAKIEEKARIYLEQQYEATRHDFFKRKLQQLFPDSPQTKLANTNGEVKETA
ncbi:hypothetical protein [Spirosoma sp. KNUC1025]|uniref:hypothetical protein n=1 Tax=Spirosoma sp. KNUC1025 TaxID=2894082 RepID=UPI00386D71A3|nr:hypothetical protein LN737_22795 [Spirosoma sp. KNUC1025]